MKVYLDTNCVIYLVEKNPTWLQKVMIRINQLRTANDKLVVGDLTVAECLAGPFMSGNATLEATYRAFFTDPDIQVLPMTLAVCERAARIRADHRFELVDSLHLAAAIEHICDVFLTNDVKLARCAGITVEILR